MATDKEKIAAEIERRKMKAIMHKKLFLATEYENIASFIYDLPEEPQPEEIIAQERQLCANIYAQMVVHYKLGVGSTYTNLYKEAKEAAGEFMSHEYGKMYIDAKEWQQKAK